MIFCSLLGLNFLAKRLNLIIHFALHVYFGGILAPYFVRKDRNGKSLWKFAFKKDELSTWHAECVVHFCFISEIANNVLPFVQSNQLKRNWNFQFPVYFLVKQAVLYSISQKPTAVGRCPAVSLMTRRYWGARRKWEAKENIKFLTFQYALICDGERNW